MKKSTLVAGIQPTNRLTLGNYLGAIKKVVNVQDDYDCLLFVADLHSITIPLTYHKFNYKELEEFKWNVIKMYVACGIDLEKTTIFIQSEVKEHLELFYFLTTYSTLGELRRMTQYKHLSKKFVEPNGTEMALTGLLIYPVLMAADILIYDSEYVSIGEDQTQHLELTIDIARRINERFNKDLFTIPKSLNERENKVGLKIKDLQDPTKKMSKSSENYEGVIFMDDSAEEIRRKIMKAKTDSIGKISLDRENQMGVVNLLEIHSAISESTLADTYNYFKDKSYKELKEEVANLVVSELSRIQEKFKSLNTESLMHKISENNAACRKRAKIKLDQVYDKT
ncbi:Tryptophanyl-tRNA synthetase [Mycoplasma haemocanis str. Illinois]|uniref:Tryptophan--tRNA ligase n=1 Tax=Mycoplasma haemocanis (strain Illinois) TaxID=1111676 RepID=H6N8N4_MYCHN|nr:tryptophan--tRNA ligase [Mycoplasma haemocanis]AEW46006.1 Tryptophanyl-tRNA synthetase [Mycoplasma haemocanis str. Illinois]